MRAAARNRVVAVPGSAGQAEARVVVAAATAVAIIVGSLLIILALTATGT